LMEEGPPREENEGRKDIPRACQAVGRARATARLD